MRRAALLLALLPLGAAAQMYKCVDANGVTHYADRPRPGCKGSEVDIRPSPPISGTVREPAADFARKEADFRRRQHERERIAAKERAALEARCTSLRREQARLTSGRPLVRIDERGERIYVPDEARAQRLAQVREAMRACP